MGEIWEIRTLPRVKLGVNRPKYQRSPSLTVRVRGLREGEYVVKQPLFQPDLVNRVDLLTLVEPAAASTVSRTLLVQPNFRLILFSMDAGQEISEHRSPFFAMVHVLSGRLRMDVCGAAQVLEANSWLSMPPDAPHALHAESPTRFLLTMVRTPEQAAAG